MLARMCWIGFPFRDPADVPNGDIIRYHEDVAALFRGVGHIPLRDDSLVTCAEILAYYRGNRRCCARCRIGCPRPMPTSCQRQA